MRHWYKTKSSLKRTLLAFTLLITLVGKSQMTGGTIYLLSTETASAYPGYSQINTGYYCASTNSVKIYAGADPYGGTAPFAFQWQYSSNSTSWTNVVGATLPDYDSAKFVINYSANYYRRKATDALGVVAYTSSVNISKCSFSSGMIGFFSNSTVSYSTAIPDIAIAVGYQPPAILGIGGYVSSTSQPSYYDFWKSANNSVYSYYSNYYNTANLPSPSIEYSPKTVYYKRSVFNQDCDHCTNDNNSYTTAVSLTFTANQPFDAGAIVPINPVATIGNTIAFINNGSPNNAAPYYYQWQDSIPNSSGWNDISGATNATYQETLTQHKYFRRRVWSYQKIAFSNNQYLRSINAINNFVNTNVNTYILNNVTGNYWFDVADASGNVVGSINPGTNNLGTVTLQMKHFGTGVAGVPVANNGVTYMPRYFEISSSAYPTGNIPAPVGVRLYNKNTELADFKTKVGNSNITTSNLRISHYHGINQDCDVNNNAAGGTVELTPTNAPFADGFYLQFNANSFSEFGIVSNLGPLPVTWMNFTGSLKDKTVLLNWNVANQTNNKGFEVQRSSDGRSFQPIGFVNAAAANGYSFVDATPLNNLNFYRLRQVDNDGAATYSNTITLRTGSKLQFAVFPNPVTDYFSVQAATTENIKYHIVNASGQVVSSGITTNNKKIDVSTLPKGTYALQLFTTADKQVFKIVRQ